MTKLNKKNTKKFSKIINHTLHDLMKRNKKVVCFGLGINDPKGIFGTTLNLKKKFGSNRVFDMPISENAITGIALGLSLNNYIPIVTHQRLDFFLLAMDQLVNNLAKWKYMFSSKKKTTVIIRLIVGRGWGQGPTHSQSLQSWFVHIPGIKVLAPAFASDYKNLLNQSIKQPGPTIVIEHRWLHELDSKINKKRKKTNIANILSKGKSITIITYSYSTIEILQLKEILNKSGVYFDHIDLCSLKPLNYDLIFKSVKKTGKLIILDNLSHNICSIGKDIISNLIEKDQNIFKISPKLLTLPDYPSPTSHYLTKNFYVNKETILRNISEMTKIKIKDKNKINIKKLMHDVPNLSFNGPF